jgi:GTP-binding protein Era
MAMAEFRSGFIALVGRPNVGKSTLANALVGEKVAITSPKPETTRRVIRGMVNGDGFQLVLVDTPGLHRPRTLLGERLNDLVREALADVDAAVACLPANQPIGPGDRFLLTALPKHIRRVAAVTKADMVARPALVEKLTAVDQEAAWDGIVPCSGRTGDGIGELVAVLAGLMPPGPQWYPDGQTSDQDLEARIGELVREAALKDVREELPHSVAVLVDTLTPPEQAGGVTRIEVSLYVERDSQKGIIIGRRGEHLKAIGTRARPGIEALVGGRVFLAIHVKVAKEWQRDPKALRKLGF